MAAGQRGVNRIGSLPGSVTSAVDRVGWLEDWRVGAALLAVAATVAASWVVLAHTWREGRQEVPYALAFASAHLGPVRRHGTAPPAPLGRLRPTA